MLPKKVIIAGKYSNVLKNPEKHYPYVGFLDTDQWSKSKVNSNYRQPLFADQTMLKCFTVETS
jgi:hypothetical protein